MIILAIKTDQPEAELWLWESDKQLTHIKWTAHRKLAETLNSKIDGILNKSSKSLDDIEGIICYKGPGSFTGMRVGLSAANALAYAQGIPIVACSGQNWLANGLEQLKSGHDEKIVLPEYGGPAHISKAKK